MGTALKVRKQFILEPQKVKSVREITKAKTDTEAINKAMDIVIANSKTKETLISIKGKGNIKDIYGRTSR
ncbi:MAG: hypothetical protein A2Y97_00930 [Nitrospirae bacterium RBG_13_39_12]|nr:MAG: hypothetical protein A2Y97_00930 [Nitrospirae bacterium RBG_13_39_12]